MKLTILAALTGSAAAFAPSGSIGMSSTGLYMSNETTATTKEPAAAVTAPIVKETPLVPAAIAINGWTADAALPCYGLPDTVSPLGFFGPLGFSKIRI